jgi:excisionase family DNA binding protein
MSRPHVEVALVESDVLTASEAASLLRVGRNALYDGCARGEIPHRRVGRLLRFSRTALLAWLGAPDRERMAPWSEQVAKEGE